MKPEEALALNAQSATRYALIDVRSEGEFEQNGIPGWTNAPILDNTQRHEVGLTYKIHGKAAAIEKGHQQVDREKTVKSWKALIGKKKAIVTCWRGGLRSQTAGEWIQEEGVPVETVEGGHKAMRRLLLKTIEDCPEPLVLSGFTGSGKTELIQSTSAPKVDLEGLAVHRGSSFGKFLDTPQPTQSVFENGLALELMKIGGRRFLCEDESLSIGGIRIPKKVFEKMRSAKVVRVNEPLDARTRRIFKEYVLDPLGSTQPLYLRNALLDNAARLKARLGKAIVHDVQELIHLAFDHDPHRPDRHFEWIQILLTHYYDPIYERNLERSQRTIRFEGSLSECQAFIESDLQ